ncbi:MAG: hypothetical protein KDC30_18670, partial [Saprospiraceae bacterium]|nr:hypothetical protein [Saprospiraceae bacterium]
AAAEFDGGVDEAVDFDPVESLGSWRTNGAPLLWGAVRYSVIQPFLDQAQTDDIAEMIGHACFARLVGKIGKLARIERVCLRNGVS